MKLAEVDHRLSPRQAVQQPVSAALSVGGRTYETSVVDYSIHGLSVRVENGAVKRAQRENFEVELSLPDQTEMYSGKIRYSRTDRQNAVLGINLKSAAAGDEEVSFLSNDPGWDLIEDPETLKNIFADLAYKGPEAPIAFRKFRNRAVLLAQKIVDDRVLVAEVFEKKGSVEMGRASFRFEIFQTCHAFEASVVAVRGNLVDIELPKNVARLLRRETVRIVNGRNDVRLNVRLHSKFLGISPEDVEVLDFSEHGLSVLDTTGWAYAPRGVTFDSIVFTTAAGEQIRGSGVICGHRWLADRDAYSVGIHFETASDDDRNRWHNAILEARYPTLSFDYQPKDHKEIWDLFVRSDYLHLKGKEAYTEIIDLTAKTWVKLAEAGAQWSKRIMIRMEDLVVGHLQMDRVYPSTWCIHHLAIDPKISKVVARDIYAVMTDVLHAEKANYVLSFTEAAKPWNQRTYYDFVKSYRYPEHNELKSFQIYNARTDASSKIARDSTIGLRQASQYDLRRISRFFELYSSPLERNACALTYEDLELQGIQDELKAVDLERQRAFVVAYQGTHMVGFARVETATPGVNIVGVFDMLYVHILPEFTGRDLSIRQTLIAGGLEKFRQLGKHEVLLALDDEYRENHEASGLKFVTDAVRWIALRDCVSRYYGFTQMLYGHLIFRRELIHKKRPNK